MTSHESLKSQIDANIGKNTKAPATQFTEVNYIFNL